MRTQYWEHSICQQVSLHFEYRAVHQVLILEIHQFVKQNKGPRNISGNNDRIKYSTALQSHLGF